MKLFLGLSALAWLPYGLFCLANPAFLAEAAGVTYASPTGATEIRAMYGGLQAAIGLLAVAALLREDLVRTALVTILFLTAGLGTARLVGAAVDGAATGYTIGAVVFELLCATIALVLLRRTTGAATV